MKRSVKTLRRRLWESLRGCTCSPVGAKNERCTLAWIRCNGRLAAQKRSFETYGLAWGPGSSDGDGLDPEATPKAVAKREAALRQIEGGA